MAVENKKLCKGYNKYAEIDGKNSDMLMDMGVYLFEDNEKVTFFEDNKETAFLVLLGEGKFFFDGKEEYFKRNSLFEENPFVLHIPKGVKVEIQSINSLEVLIQKTKNDKIFDTVYYTPEIIEERILGDNVLNNTSRRVIRDVFNYDNAPYSKMVLGEVITLPGKWSSYPPHHHPQPEIYYYRFDRDNGFGTCYIGDNAYKVENNSSANIEGGLTHPQNSAPGYAMYYAWLIRHLDNEPWTKRIDDPKHTWTLEKDIKIFEPKI